MSNEKDDGMSLLLVGLVITIILILGLILRFQIWVGKIQGIKENISNGKLDMELN